MRKEVEVKLEINSFDKLRNLLVNSGWKKEYSTNEQVAYFDDDSDSWMKKGVTIRIKKINDKNIFTVKRKNISEEYRVADENEVEVESFEKIADILNMLDLKPVFQYSKNREHWTSDKGKIELDYIPQLSKSFIEVESDEIKKVEEIIEDLCLGDYPRNSKSYPDIIKESLKK